MYYLIKFVNHYFYYDVVIGYVAVLFSSTAVATTIHRWFLFYITMVFALSLQFCLG